MVSQTLPRDAGTESKPSELRPMDATRDFAEVARVIEIAFAEELSPGSHIIMRDLHFMSTISPLLSLLGRAIPSLRDYFSGYVWESDGRVVANTTVSRADNRGTQWIISNVAVLPAYRRQGIARAMMEAAIEH
ncbi:MAG: GNAT family N-acetyltransferase, partial [Ardenticatenales bacterium]|nr:GNAT family N-acetyltransferase [Ardenticatenales bacterium]